MLHSDHSVRSLIGLFVFVAAVCGIGSVALAQDFRVATKVSHRNAAETRWGVRAQSVTLFHAGKVYDYMERLAEVVVFEPAQSRFVILSFNGNELATTLQFEELQQFLKIARSETAAHFERINPAAADPRERQRRDALRFQLNPTFEESFEPASGMLLLRSPLVRYEVETDATKRPLVTQQYLQYADWAARMNYVLHSGTLLPDVRLAVNRALLEHERIPTEVRLQLEGDTPLQLKAEHKFDWSLGSVDKSMIRRCENARIADTTRWVDFREYQRTLLTTTASRYRVTD